MNNNEIKTVHYICDQCLDHEEIKFQSTFNFCNKEEIEGHNKSLIYHTNPKLEVFCKKCDNFMFECDELLVPIIIKLNELKFLTINCCEGHYYCEDDNNGSSSMPYIMFNDDITSDFGLIEKALSIALSKYESMLKSVIESGSFNEYDKEIYDLVINKQIPFMVTDTIYCIRANSSIIDYFYENTKFSTFESMFASIKQHFIEICYMLVDILEKMEE